MLLVFLPDDSARESPLRGRDPHAVALEHLILLGYIGGAELSLQTTCAQVRSPGFPLLLGH